MTSQLKFIIISFAFIIISQSIVDRTYFIYLGLPITATSSDIQKAYEEKKIKIEGLDNEEAKVQKMKLLEEGIQLIT